MKVVVFLLFILLCSTAQAGGVDSVKYEGEYLKVYPFSQKVKLKYYDFTVDSDEHNVFVPLGKMEDGKYIQYAEVTNGPYGSKRKFKWMNWQKNGEIPYAIFLVQNNELNGMAVILRPNGDTLTYGKYVNNLREGQWKPSANRVNYQTYQEGVLNGTSYFERRKRLHTRNYINDSVVSMHRTTSEYSDGVLQSSVTIDSMYNSIIRLEKVIITTGKGQGKYKLKKFQNGVLVANGVVNEDGDWDDRVQFYDSETGKLHAKLKSKEINVSLDDLFRFWVEHLVFEDSTRLALTLQGIKTFKLFYGPDFEAEAFKTLNYDENKSYSIYLGGEYYYPNGQKMIEIYNNIGMLYDQHGNQKYRVKHNHYSQEFVALYYDRDQLVREIRVPDDIYRDEQEKMIYKGVELNPSGSGDSYFYYNYPVYDSIRSADSIIYFEIYHDGEKVVDEISFDPSTLTRTEYHNMSSDSSGGVQYEIEIKETFSEDFLNSHVEIRTNYYKDFEVRTSLDINYKSIVFDNKIPLNAYEVSNILGERFSGYTPAEEIVNLIDYNYLDPDLTITSVESHYYYKDSLYTGRVSFRWDMEHGIREKGDKIVLGVSEYEFSGAYGYMTYDRIGVERAVNHVMLLPDFYYKLPGFVSGYSNFHLDFQGFEALIIADYATRYDGSFLNGQLHGEWKAYDYYGKCLTASFDQGKPAETYEILTPDRKNRKRKVKQQVYFENHEVQSLRAYDDYDNLSLVVDYTEGVPTRLETFFHGGKGILDEHSTALFDNGELSYVRTIRFWQGKETLSEARCVDEAISGTITIDGDSGIIENGLFTGIITSSGGKNKRAYEFIEKGVKIRVDIINTNDILVRRLVMDTIRDKSFRAIIEVYEEFPITRIPNSYWKLVKGSSSRYKYDTGYYPNGTIRYSGYRDYLGDERGKERLRTWSYYNPRGELIALVDYNHGYWRDHFKVDEVKFERQADIILYKNGYPEYEGVVIDRTFLYDCDADKKHELRTIFVEQQFLENGDTILRPSGSFRQYYDTGELQSEGELLNGLPHGIYKYYDYEGGLISIGEYVNGKKTGKWLSGDLTGLAFIGDFCLSPSAFEFNPDIEEDLRKDLEVTITMYENGNILRELQLEAFIHE